MWEQDEGKESWDEDEDEHEDEAAAVVDDYEDEYEDEDEDDSSDIKCILLDPVPLSTGNVIVHSDQNK